MKRRSLTRVASMLLSVFVAFGMLAVFTEKPEAGSSSSYAVYVMNPLHVGEEGYISAMYKDTGLQVVSAKSSNPKVVSVKSQSYFDGGVKKWDCYTVGVKPGKAKLTIVYKDLNGQNRTSYKNVRVLKYPKQIKKLTVGGKTVNTNKYKFEYRTKYKKTTVPVKLELKDGWKIDDAYVTRVTKYGNFKEVKIPKSMLIKGKAIKFPKNYNTLYVYIYMTNGKSYLGYTIELYR